MKGSSVTYPAVDPSSNRRNFIKAALLGLASAPFLPHPSHAQTDNWYALTGDDGKPVSNYRLPAELSIKGLPGIIWVGASEPDVTLVEFFDYNCPYCHKAVHDLDALLARDKTLRLGLVNNAILGIGSYQAAKVQQAVLRGYGPKRAYDFHRALFNHPGSNDGPIALNIAKEMGLDAAAVETAANGPIVGSVVEKQVRLADSLGFVATPSFMLNGVGLLGYPGPKSIGEMVAAVRTCDKPICK